MLGNRREVSKRAGVGVPHQRVLENHSCLSPLHFVPFRDQILNFFIRPQFDEHRVDTSMFVQNIVHFFDTQAANVVQEIAPRQHAQA